MKKLILAMFVILFSCAIYGCTLNLEKNSQNLSSYLVNLTLNDESKKLNGDMEVSFVNNTNSSFNFLEFNLFANAFREGSSQSVIGLSKSADCYYNGESFGYINITKVNGENVVDFEVCGTDQNILKVNFNSKILPTQKAKIFMEFEIQIPNISHRFGVGESTINLGNFLPILCVYENGKFCELEYTSNGDPFYSECANYEVNFCYPQKYTMASTGEVIEESENNNLQTSKIQAKAVRDFAIVLSEKFTKVSDDSLGYKVNYFYYNDLNYEKSLETCVLAMKTYGDLFGKYPYNEIDVVQSNFCIGGMEFPNIVLIGDDILDKETYYYVIVHELAHQWWYGLVGNNQTDYAWIDEGLAEYSSALFYEKNKGYEYDYKKLVQRANSSLQIYEQIYTDVLGELDTSMNRNLNEFKTENEYVYNIYVRGFLMFDSLSNLLSEKVVIKCLKNYYITYAFKVSSPECIIESFEKTTSCSLESYFNSWLEGKVVFGT